MLAVVFKCLTCSTFDSATDDVTLRNVGALLADVMPLNLTDICSAAKGGGRAGTRAKPGNRLVINKPSREYARLESRLDVLRQSDSLFFMLNNPA